MFYWHLSCRWQFHPFHLFLLLWRTVRRNGCPFDLQQPERNGDKVRHHFTKRSSLVTFVCSKATSAALGSCFLVQNMTLLMSTSWDVSTSPDWDTQGLLKGNLGRGFATRKLNPQDVFCSRPILSRKKEGGAWSLGACHCGAFAPCLATHLDLYENTQVLG